MLTQSRQIAISVRWMFALLAGLLLFVPHFSDASTIANSGTESSVVDLGTEIQGQTGPVHKRLDTLRCHLLIQIELALEQVAGSAASFQNLGFSPGRLVLQGSGSAQSPPFVV